MHCYSFTLRAVFFFLFAIYYEVSHYNNNNNIPPIAETNVEIQFWFSFSFFPPTYLQSSICKVLCYLFLIFYCILSWSFQYTYYTYEFSYIWQRKFQITLFSNTVFHAYLYIYLKAIWIGDMNETINAKRPKTIECAYVCISS